MKKFVSLTLLTFVSVMLISNAFAQTNLPNAKQQLKDKLYKLTSFKASFTQTVTDMENTVLQQAQGKIAMNQPNKLYWELLEPNESVLLADGKTLWNIDPFMEQVVADDQHGAIENNPLILLTDPDSHKWQDFNVVLESEHFVIQPVVPAGNIEVLRLLFNDDNLVGLETRDTQQQTSRLSFTDIQQNQPIQGARFTFTMPDGYELDDQRNP